MNKIKKTGIRLISLALALLLTAAMLVGCSGAASKSLMSLEGQQISVGMYEFLLSRMRAMLEYNGVSVGNENFWKTQIQADGETMTYEEFYKRSILESCKTFLVAQYLFEQRGLKLEQTDIKSVEQDLQKLMDDNADGSKSKFNSVLAAYGVNYNLLKEIYLIEKKVAALRSDLYGVHYELISESVKDAYVAKNYVHFKQILLANYAYVYEKDVNGDEIYYYADGEHKDHICYDTVNGIPDEAGKKDENGDVVYYTAEGRIAYQTEKGTRAYKTDTNGAYITEKYSKDKIEELQKKAEVLMEAVQTGAYEDFEALMEKNGDDTDGQEHYTDGYYLNRGVSYTGDVAYIADIIKTLDGMAEGECAIVESNYGFHVIMKYGISSGAYSKTVNSEFFESLSADIAEELFLAECAKYYDQIRLDEKVLSGAASIRTLASNFDY